MRTRAGILVASLAVCAISPDLGAQEKPKTEASREDRDRALELFRKSEDSYQQGKFDEAARLLEEAYALHEEPVLLYNLARAYEGMGELDKAVDAYKRYLAGSPDAKDRGAIQRRVETLENQIADQERLEAERKRLDAQRKRQDQKKDQPDPEPTPEPATSSPGIWPWVTAGVGVALVGTGAVFGVMSQSKRDEAEDDPVHRSASESFRDAETMATTANVLFVVGGLVTAGGITWIVLSRGSKPEQAALRVGVGPGNVAVGGNF